MKTATSLRRNKLAKLMSRKGFSLIELLVVIAVIGIIAAIAIPNIGNLTGSATTAKNQRNAQTIASVSSAAMAAGHNPAATAQAEIDALQAGVSNTTVSGAVFKIDITDTEYQAATDGGYLTYTQARGFSYNQAGTNSTP